MSLYRKYRPLTLEEVIGHGLNTTILKNAARQDRLSHAYLFYGQRGTGKTTTARILAKIANCETRLNDPKFKNEGEPCNTCRACQIISSGQALDVVEIDAASNRGIDEIRDLQEGAKLSPVILNRKIFIIDEVHMLTQYAFNALLKILEEPPAHAIFILATTELSKVPATILSRTQRFSFERISKSDISTKLKKLAAAENIKIDDDGLSIITDAADGSMRDAETLLDQVAAFADNQKITAAKVESIIGKTGSAKLFSLLEKVFLKNKEDLLNTLSAEAKIGLDFISFNQDLIRYLGRLMSLTANPKMESILKTEITDLELANLKHLASISSIQDQIRLAKLLISAHREMRYSPFALIPLQIALLEFTSN